MDTSEAVLEAARRRADALATRDQDTLRRLLHPQFRWVSHTGERFDRDSYVESNTAAATGPTRPARLDLSDVDVITHDRTAVLRCEVVESGDGIEQLRTAMTQVWVRYDDSWVCLAGHTELSRSSAY